MLGIRLAALALLVLPPVKIPQTTGNAEVAPTSPSTAPTSTTKPATPTAPQQAPEGSNAVRKPDRCEDFLLEIPPVSLHPLNQHLDGDKEMAGKKIRIVPHAQLSALGDRVVLDVSVRFTELRGDDTTFRMAKQDIVVFDARAVEANCMISGLGVGGDGFEVVSKRNDHSNRTYINPRQRLISNVRCTADGPGKDFGKVGCDAIRFRPVKVELERGTQCGRRIVNIPLRDLFPFAKHVEGDKQMGFNKASLSLSARLRADRRSVRLELQGRLRELVPDHTTFTGSNKVEVFRALPGCEVDKVSETAGLLQFQTDGGDERSRTKAGKGIIRNAKCITEAQGRRRDHGRVGCTNIQFATLFVETRPRQPTLSPR